MKHINILTTLLVTLTISTAFSQLNASDGYVLLRNQVFGGDNASALIYKSNYVQNAQMIFMEKDSTIYGAIRGIGNDKFGLTDASGDFFLFHKKNKHIKFSIEDEDKMIIRKNGHIGIGTNDPMYKLDVCGTVRATEVLVEDDWCDYVFEEDYPLPTLEDEKEHIEKNGYLLGFQSEKEMDGKISLHDVTKRQQVKIEEFALQLIQLNERNKKLEQHNADLTKNYKVLEAMLIQLQNQNTKESSSP